MKKHSRYWIKRNIWSFSAFLKEKYNGICPYGKKYLDALVGNCIRDIVLGATIAIGFIFLWNCIVIKSSMLYLLESICFAIYLVMLEVPNYKLQKKENRIYRELLIYFSRVKHKYLANHHIANAVLEAGLDMSYEIQRLSDELYHVLMECDRKEKVREYILNHRTNRYLKLFLIQAYEASEKGDLVGADGISLFSKNVEHLRLELMEALYRRKKREYEFAGYTFVAVTPVFMMPVFKQWGLDFAPELDFFYAGTGIIIETITFCATIIIYRLIAQAKEIALFTEGTKEKLDVWEWFYRLPMISFLIHRMERIEGKLSMKIRHLLFLVEERVSYGKFCVQIMLIAGTSFLLMSLFFTMVHKKERLAVLSNVETMDVIAPIAGEEKKAKLEQHILDITKQYKQEKHITETQIKTVLRERIYLGSETMEAAAVKEIQNKIKQYEKAHYSVKEFFISLLMGLFMGTVPIWKLCYQTRMIYAGAVHEVRLFQTLIIMERRIQGITIVSLLEDMEVFSKCFKEILQRCTNTYGSGAERALHRLKEDGKRIYEGFEELADAFLSVDEIGIELAFQEIESNRKLLEKMTQLEAEINMEKKKDITDLIAKVPMLLSVGVYFVIPFFAHALQGVYEVFELMEGMQT